MYGSNPDIESKNQNKMKKALSLLFVATAMSFAACGPNAEEKAKMDADAQAKMDSLFNAASQSMATDSTAMDSAAAPEAAPMEEKH